MVIVGIIQHNEKAVEHEGEVDTNCNWCAWNGPQRLRKKTVGIRNQSQNRNNPDYSIVKMGQYTENHSGDLRRLAVTHAPVKDHELKSMWKVH